MNPCTVLAVGFAVFAGCAAPPIATEGNHGPSSHDPACSGADCAPVDGPSSSSADGGAPASGAQDTGPVALVVIDVQQVFFDTAAKRSPSSNVAARMDREARMFALVGKSKLPTFITFEATKTGDHALPASLASALPSQAQQFIKTTFAATSQPQVLPALKAAGATRLVVIGAETDVCVLQTVLGLRRAGYDVIAVPDAIFTEEVNTAPALRRMKQAGVVQLGMAEAEMLLTNPSTPSPAPPTLTKAPIIVRPLEMGFVLHDLEGLNAADPNSSPKMVRLRELLLVSEWFRIPLLAEDPAKALAVLPANLKSIITRPIVALASRPSNITQLAIAGGHASIVADVTAMAGNAEVFLLEDALLGASAAELEPLYVNGAVPSTYKMMYYELTQSVDDAQWPSPQWVTDGQKYYDLTMAPEELPPLSVP